MAILVVMMENCGFSLRLRHVAVSGKGGKIVSSSTIEPPDDSCCVELTFENSSSLNHEDYPTYANRRSC
jgi:hypothetical protein